MKHGFSSSTWLCKYKPQNRTQSHNTGFCSISPNCLSSLCNTGHEDSVHFCLLGREIQSVPYASLTCNDQLLSPYVGRCRLARVGLYSVNYQNMACFFLYISSSSGCHCPLLKFFLPIQFSFLKFLPTLSPHSRTAIRLLEMLIPWHYCAAHTSTRLLFPTKQTSEHLPRVVWVYGSLQKIHLSYRHFQISWPSSSTKVR